MKMEVLITTIATSTAALVAIIGGFLVSRVLTLSSEQSGILRKVREISKDIQAKKQLLTTIDKQLLDLDAEDFIQEHYKRLISEQDFEAILEEHYQYRGYEELKPYVNELYSVWNDFYKRSQQNIESEHPEVEFNHFFKKYKFEFPNRRNWYEMLFVWRAQVESHDPMKRLLEAHDVIMPNSATEDYKQKANNKANMEYELKVLRLRRDEQKKLLGEFGKPKGLWMGLLVLVYACAVGVAYPITLLPYPVGIYDDQNTKSLLLSLFFSELIFLFVYLAYYTFILTKRENEEYR
ncbi:MULTISPECIES: hypothetical protein [Pontibacillus]|uniref:Uncharacterized protein n=1 Tax=Pontibacillus chungwhensis TaxID=265426 RepID=A0ABY8UZP4_9BACI|nr:MULTISPECIES: hypothetical protein [Pontibacillus]MCD5324763.1 hypothetical protein [Pontibacillus sp. HN14]WIF98723.1 hypothetical protein QNI29_03465 [Pontibacillus chungwhensis]